MGQVAIEQSVVQKARPKIRLLPRKQSKRRVLEFYLFISPWFIIFVLFGIIPMLWGLYLSFTNYTGYNFSHLRFIGAENYHLVFTDSQAMQALARTAVLTFIGVPLGVIIGFLLAVLLNNKVKGLSMYRTIFYLPAILPTVASGLIWQMMYQTDGGILNTLFGFFGMKPIDWMGYGMAQPSFIISGLWGASGGLMIYLAGLKGIPQSLIESASIDGANYWRQFIHITIPLMTPILFFNLLMGLIGSFQNFLQPLLLTGLSLTGDPIQPIYLYMNHAWINIFVFDRFGYGLALLWVLFAVILIFALIVFWSQKYWVHYESGED